MTRRIVFFPSCGGQGFGHLNRCTLLAREMNRRGWDARLCVTPARATALANSGVACIPVERLDYSTPSSGNAPAYTCLSNGNLQALRDGFISFPRVARSVNAALAAVDDFQPDVIVGDLSLLAWIVGQRRQIPVAQLVRSIIYPPAHQIFWWRDPPTGDLPPDIRPVFNPLLRWWKLPMVNSVEDLMRGNLYLVPSIPSLDPLPYDPAIHYTGALLDPARAAIPLPDGFPDRRNRPVIYITFGAGVSPQQARPLLYALHSAVSGSGWQVVFSGGNRFDAQALAELPGFRTFGWLPGIQAITASDVVVYHGGQNTTLELAACGVPGLVLPFQSEQEANGRRLEQQGAARVISPLDSPEGVRVVRSRRWYRPFQTCIVPQFAPDPAELRATLTRLLEQPSYRENAARLRAETQQYGGVEQAADFLAAYRG